MAKKERKTKQIDLSPEAIIFWSKKAIDEGTNFKVCVEQHLEKLAKK